LRDRRVRLGVAGSLVAAGLLEFDELLAHLLAGQALIGLSESGKRGGKSNGKRDSLDERLHDGNLRDYSPSMRKTLRIVCIWPARYVSPQRLAVSGF
jgi:hypothetical protein